MTAKREPTPLFRIAYDATLKRPGCAIIQAAAGCTVPNFAGRFDPATWLTHPTPGMAVYEVTPAQLDRLAASGGAVCRESRHV